MEETANPKPPLLGMTVAPIPVLVLLGMVQLGVITILDVVLPKISAVGAIFAVIPVVVILVFAVVDTSLFLVVVLALFLAFVVLRRSSGPECHRRDQGGSQDQVTQVSVSELSWV